VAALYGRHSAGPAPTGSDCARDTPAVKSSWSRTTKQVSNSSKDQGGGKRRAGSFRRLGDCSQSGHYFGAKFDAGWVRRHANIHLPRHRLSDLFFGTSADGNRCGRHGTSSCSTRHAIAASAVSGCGGGSTKPAGLTPPTFSASLTALNTTDSNSPWFDSRTSLGRRSAAK
jgi:hypothetical protein